MPRDIAYKTRFADVDIAALIKDKTIPEICEEYGVDNSSFCRFCRQVLSESEWKSRKKTIGKPAGKVTYIEDVINKLQDFPPRTPVRYIAKKLGVSAQTVYDAKNTLSVDKLIKDGRCIRCTWRGFEGNPVGDDHICALCRYELDGGKVFVYTLEVERWIGLSK